MCLIVCKFILPACLPISAGDEKPGDETAATKCPSDEMTDGEKAGGEMAATKSPSDEMTDGEKAGGETAATKSPGPIQQYRNCRARTQEVQTLK